MGWNANGPGAYVRLMAGDTDEDGRPKYRVHRLKGIDKSQAHGRYTIEYQGRQVSDSRALICQYGKAVRLFRMADVSNGDIDEVSPISLYRADVGSLSSLDFASFRRPMVSPCPGAQSSSRSTRTLLLSATGL